MSAGEQTIICVLGMSRTGTSLTARMLNLAGVYLGAEEDLLDAELDGLPEESRMDARRANPAGFWEHYPMMRLNERILRKLGGSWREPPMLPAGWEARPELSAEREEALSLVERSFGDRDLWGWKDPRNSLTLPFWQSLIPEMRYVICLRNPIEVADSLRRRDGISVDRALELWLHYLVRALVNTSGRPRLLIAYEAYFRDPSGSSARLARFAACDGGFKGAEGNSELADAIDERLWRHRSHLEDVTGDSGVPDEVVLLHLLTEALASAQCLAHGDHDATVRELEEAADRLAARLCAAGVHR